MPAVQLERLYRQAAELAEWYLQPEKFVLALRDMLEFYADRTHRRGQAGKPAMAIKAYKVPGPVMRRILHELRLPLKADPGAALPLVDALWAREVFEFRKLAIDILSQLPLFLVDEVIARIHQWTRDNHEEQLLDVLAKRAPQTIRQQDQGAFLGYVRTWVHSKSFIFQRLGLLALQPLLQDEDFTNLPAIYSIFEPLFADLPKTLRADLLLVMRPLVQRSPKEAAFFLRQRLEQTERPKQARWLVRRLLADFPEDLRAGLRAISKKPGNSVSGN